MQTTLKLGAVPFDMQWAKGEIKQCRIRFRKRGIYVLEIDDDEILSLLCHLWVCVVAGEVGSFTPDADRPLNPQLRAYVVGCIDNEVMRYLRCEGSRSLFSMGRGEAHPQRLSLEGSSSETPLDRSVENLAGYVDMLLPWDDSDPMQILLERESNAGFAAGGHPAQIGGLLASWMERGYAMDLRLAQAIRARRRSGDGVTPAKTRINFAWAIVMTCNDHDRQAIRRLAPLLCSRWIDEDSRGTRKLISVLYPGLKSKPSIESIASREARNALRFLATRAEYGASVGPQHLAQVEDDAIDAMVNWAGVRSSRRKKGEEGKDQEIGAMRAIA